MPRDAGVVVPGVAGRRVHARGLVVVEPGRGGLPRLRTARCEPPLGVRLAGGEVHLLGTAMGPLGGDDLALEVVVRAGTRVTVRQVAATVVLPGDGGASRQRLDVTVEPGASLRWLPEPLVAAAGCDHTSTTNVQLHGDAELVWRDELVLGRSGETAGALAQVLRITRDGAPLVHHGVDTSAAAAAAPVLGTARALGFAVLAGVPARTLRDVAPSPDATVERLADDLVTVTALAADATTLRATLDARSGV